MTQFIDIRPKQKDATPPETTRTLLREIRQILLLLLRAIWAGGTFHEEESEPGFSNALRTSRIIIAIALLVIGVVYTSVFLPLAIQTASQMNLDVVGVMLLQEFHPSVSATASQVEYPRFQDQFSRPSLYSLGAFYGICSFVFLLVLLCCSFLRVAIIAGGVLLGICYTAWLGPKILPGHSGLILQLNTLFLAKICYVVLAYLACEGMNELMGNLLHRREKTEFVIDSLCGMFCAYVISRGFGLEAGVMTGGLFVGITFASMVVLEIIMRGCMRLVRGLAGKRFTQTLLDHELQWKPRDLKYAVKRIRLKDVPIVVALIIGGLVFPFLTLYGYRLLLAS